MSPATGSPGPASSTSPSTERAAIRRPARRTRPTRRGLAGPGAAGRSTSARGGARLTVRRAAARRRNGTRLERPRGPPVAGPRPRRRGVRVPWGRRGAASRGRGPAPGRRPPSAPRGHPGSPANGQGRRRRALALTAPSPRDRWARPRGRQADGLDLESDLLPGGSDESRSLEENAGRPEGQPSRHAQQVRLLSLGCDAAPRRLGPVSTGLGAELHRTEGQAGHRLQEGQAERPRRLRAAAGRARGGRSPLQPDRPGAQALPLLAQLRERRARLVPLPPRGRREAEVQPQGEEEQEGGGQPAGHGVPPTHRARTKLRTSFSRTSGPGSTSRNCGARSMRSSRRSHAAASRATTESSIAPPRT